MREGDPIFTLSPLQIRDPAAHSGSDLALNKLENIFSVSILNYEAVASVQGVKTKFSIYGAYLDGGGEPRADAGREAATRMDPRETSREGWERFAAWHDQERSQRPIRKKTLIFLLKTMPGSGPIAGTSKNGER
jgi:hypothetical protein